MPGDPKECRQHALNCVRLAQTAVTPQSREHFANLAQTWVRLAEDLERAQAFLNVLDGPQEHSILRYAMSCGSQISISTRLTHDAVQLAVELMEDTQASSSRRRC